MRMDRDGFRTDLGGDIFSCKFWTGEMQIELDTGPRRGEMVFRCIEQET